MNSKKDCFAPIGARIRSGRIAQGLTQKQLADELEVTGQHISDIERGAVGVSVPLLMQLCRRLDRSADWLLFGK